jgi:CheY-like chemotaxis protein
MCATLSLARPTALVIHDDGEALDVLTRLFEAAGFEVTTALTGFRAQAHLEGERPIDVVVVPWDAAHPVGGEVYRWSLQRRYDLRDVFVFLAAETPADFDRLVVALQCLGGTAVRGRARHRRGRRREAARCARGGISDAVARRRAGAAAGDGRAVRRRATRYVTAGHGAILRSSTRTSTRRHRRKFGHATASIAGSSRLRVRRASASFLADEADHAAVVAPAGRCSARAPIRTR